MPIALIRLGAGTTDLRMNAMGEMVRVGLTSCTEAGISTTFKRSILIAEKLAWSEVGAMGVW